MFIQQDNKHRRIQARVKITVITPGFVGGFVRGKPSSYSFVQLMKISISDDLSLNIGSDVNYVSHVWVGGRADGRTGGCNHGHQILTWSPIVSPFII